MFLSESRAATSLAALLALLATACEHGPVVSGPREHPLPPDAGRAAPTTDSGTPTLKERIGQFSDSVADAGFTGTILVAQDGEVLFAAGYGLADESADVPIERDTAFDTGSLSKQFTAAALLKLEEARELTLEQTLADFFDDVPDDKADITLHQLLAHTAGFVSYAFVDDYAATTREEAKALAFDSELVARPGARYEYSDTGYGIAAQVVEIVSAQTFTSYLREQLFTPAGMRRTGFYGESRWDDITVANGYLNGEDMGSPEEHDKPQWGLLGFGGVISTVDDLHRWTIALREHTVLTRDSVERLFTPYVLEERGGDSYYGYGWVVQEALGVSLVWHDGATEAHNAFLGMLDDEAQTVIAVLSNRIIETNREEVFFATETAGALMAGLVQDDLSGLPAFAE